MCHLTQCTICKDHYQMSAYMHGMLINDDERWAYPGCVFVPCGPWVVADQVLILLPHN